MINCPNCQVPNPETASVCTSCGANLAGQQFVQVLDEATPPAVAKMPQMPGTVGPYMPGYDQAQAEINQFMAEQQARKRKKNLINLTITVIILAVAISFWLRSSSREKRVKTAVTFFQNFNKLDDERIGTFWKCTVRAKDIDVHKATDTLLLTEGLEKAFRHFPKGQPDRLRDKCLPMIDTVIEEASKLEAPTGFREPLAGVTRAMKAVKESFSRYIAVIEVRKQEAIDEQEIREMNGDFHKLVAQPDAPKAIAYYNLLKCAIPDLARKAKSIQEPPDSQPVVEYIYETCKKNTKYADKLRKECFAQRNENEKKTPDFVLVTRKMSGDTRDLEAINDCFRRANQGVAQEELKAIAQTYIAYHNSREEVKKSMAKLKQEL